MPQSSYIGAFCLLLVLYPRDGDGESSAAATLPLPLGSWISIPAREEGLSDEGITSENTRGTILGLRASKEGETHRHQLLNDFHGSSSSLKELASRATEILDRISRNWALEGAKTIQNGEIRLRKLNKDLSERIEELLANGSKYGQHILECMNRTAFEIVLKKILEDTIGCYSASLRSIHAELKKIEDEEKAVVGRMDSFGKKIFEMLSTCFLMGDTPSVIECLQKVDSVHIGTQLREVEATNLILEMAGIINEIPRTFSGCTSKGLTETEAHVRKSYAQSLTCLKENIT